MTHEEQREWLIGQLLAEDGRYSGIAIPGDEQGQKDLLRALMNVRLPAPASEELLRVQDEYLLEENRRAGVTEVVDLPASPLDERLILWRGDMTALRVDAIVNAANSGMCGCFRPLHNCVDNIIHTRSGMRLRLYCDRMMREQGYEEPTSQAKITPAFDLPCRYILHTVGPIVEGPLTEEHERQLASCYRSCLRLAEENGVRSIAFCCISTGVFMFPRERAARIAVETVRAWLAETGSRMKIVFDVFKDEDLAVYRKLLMREEKA